MLVYRVETMNGHGPYQSSNLTDTQNKLLSEMRYTHGDDYAHPSPWQDCELGFILGHEYCGFISLESLRQWFDGWFDVLETAGFTISVYDAPENRVRVGDEQALISGIHNLPITRVIHFSDLPW